MCVVNVSSGGQMRTHTLRNEAPGACRGQRNQVYRSRCPPYHYAAPLFPLSLFLSLSLGQSALIVVFSTCIIWVSVYVNTHVCVCVCHCLHVISTTASLELLMCLCASELLGP